MLNLGNKVIVTDPCYKVDTWCNYIVSNVVAGTYESRVSIQRNTDIVRALTVIHTDSINNPNINDLVEWKLVSENIGVDSGTCGIYDLMYKLNAEKDEASSEAFYETACSCANDGAEQDQKGVTSRAGEGDGLYQLYLFYNDDDQVVGIKIVYNDKITL